MRSRIRPFLILACAPIIAACDNKGAGVTRRPAVTHDSESKRSDLFDVGGHRLHLECAGRGSPTIVLQHGQGDDITTWDSVWTSLAAMSRVCRYERAGMGRSERGQYPTTSAQIVSELHTLLRVANVPPP